MRRINFISKIFILPVKIITLSVFITSCNMGYGDLKLESPDGAIKVFFKLSEDSSFVYRVDYKGESVLQDSRLGVVMKQHDLSRGLLLDSVSPAETVTETYSMLVGKQKECNYRANSKTFYLGNGDEKRMDITFRVSDDGVAFRYHFSGGDGENRTILKEVTSFHLCQGAVAYIQPLAEPKSGWCQTNPSYEENYEIGVPVEELPDGSKQWIYPALFKSGNQWILLSETAPERSYCGSRIIQMPDKNVFRVVFPDERESFPGDGSLPEGVGAWSSPWRIIALSDQIGPIVESTLGTDLAKPPVPENRSFVKPGRASWSWVLLKDDSITCDVQKRFIEYAAEMNWEYCLVDVNWDTKIGYDRIRDLAAYADGLGVGLILWYNSSGSWNSTTYRPKSRLLTREDRFREFGLLRDMGIKGIKVDFFGGDGRSMMAYYQDIFTDAAGFGLMVNCHGCTLPRGWHRTYPNLVTMESVKGFEFVTFEQGNADKQPSHCCMLPFTRNVFDPMDFTPVCFSEVPGLQRRTTNAFELALSVMFWSGVQHIAEIPVGMDRVPAYVKEFMKNVPSTWDETKFVDGIPGSFVVLARRSGENWYIAGINGEKNAREVRFRPGFLVSEAQAELITDGENSRSFNNWNVVLHPDEEMILQMAPHGGVVITTVF
ncbi:MAG: glycoside hydrolase family 97 catalytic domain-containing protein [Bacteroidales bacterium]|nr:glycoside hydrolase family 97 catalytic domain-containing protein [Bacteroidales bacterium]